MYAHYAHVGALVCKMHLSVSCAFAEFQPHAVNVCEWLTRVI